MLEKKVIKVISEQLCVSISKVKLISTLGELGVEGLDRVEIVRAIDDEFGVEITDREEGFKWLDSLRTVGDIVKCIEKAVKRGKK